MEPGGNTETVTSFRCNQLVGIFWYQKFIPFKRINFVNSRFMILDVLVGIY